MKTRRYFGFLLAFLFIQSCSSGKPTASSKESSSIPTTKSAAASDVKTGPNMVAFEKLCKSYFGFMKGTLEDQIEGSEKDFQSNLQMSLNDFAQDFPNLHIESDKLLKNGECAALISLTTTIQNSSMSKLYDEEKSKQEWRSNDRRSFDPLSFTMEELLGHFMSSLDHFSSFHGYYDELFSGEGPYDWQIQFLDRSDYNQHLLTHETRNQNRKPNYLYVQFAPKYLAKDLPIHTKIYKVNDIPVNEHFYYETMREFSRSKVLKLDVRKPDDHGEYAEMVPVTLVYHALPVTHEIIFETLQEKPYKIGYLKIPEFSNDQVSENLLQALDPKNNPTFDGMIIDLRNNPGGSTKIVAQMIGSFFKEDVITSYLLDSKGKSTIEKSIDTYNPVNSYGRVIILTDFQTASAAETMAATMKDFSAALITGRSSFGKGIGQLYSANIPVTANLNGQIATTNFYIFSPSGKSWYLTGVTPDIELYEPYNPSAQQVEKRLKDLPAGTFPKPYSEQIDADFNPNVEIISQRVTNDIRAKLRAYYNSASDSEKKCTSMDTSIEENSCMLEWTKKILKKWIDIDKGVSQ